jgi:predicted dinucleotide-utilizing enzyme
MRRVHVAEGGDQRFDVLVAVQWRGSQAQARCSGRRGRAEYRERHEVEADAARFSMQIENIPSAENPRTGRLTPLSVIAALKRLSSPLAVGT